MTYDPMPPFRRDFDAARDPYTARNALGITSVGGGGISDAPSDGTLYGRLNGAWSPAQAAGSYAPINSPTFTGDPKAPTPTAGDNDTSIATTAFVTNAISTAGGSYQPLDADLTAIAGISGVQGDIIYRNASAWTRLGVGTSGQFLQTQGASANPQWATVSGGGNVSNSGTPTAGQLGEWVTSTTIKGVEGRGRLILITTQTVSSAVATVDFTSGIDATYDEYELHIFGAQVSTAAALVLRISQDSGSTWISTGTYLWAFHQSPTTAASASDNGSATGTFVQMGLAASGTASWVADGIVRFTQPSQTNRRKWFRFELAFHHATNGLTFASGTGGQNTDNAINGIRLLPSVAGNLTAGTFALYGVKK